MDEDNNNQKLNIVSFNTSVMAILNIRLDEIVDYIYSLDMKMILAELVVC